MPMSQGVISTGGSVIYSPKIMARLQENTRIIYLRARLETVTYRISLAPDRGIASPGGHTLEDIYKERVPGYEQYAEITVDVDDEPPEVIVGHIVAALDAD